MEYHCYFSCVNTINLKLVEAPVHHSFSTVKLHQLSHLILSQSPSPALLSIQFQHQLMSNASKSPVTSQPHFLFLSLTPLTNLCSLNCIILSLKMHIYAYNYHLIHCISLSFILRIISSTVLSPPMTALIPFSRHYNMVYKKKQKGEGQHL